MSVPESQQPAVNASILTDDEHSGGLTPRQIAGITIGTVFVFYLTLMFIVCVGEYCQYINGKKYKPELRRPRSQTTQHSVLDNTSRSQTYTEPSSSKSDERSSASVSHQFPSQDDKPRNTVVRKSKHAVVTEIGTNLKRNSFEGNLTKLGGDCLEPCDSPYLKSSLKDKGIAMEPLIDQQCEDQGYDKSDILSESFDTNEDYKLEANV